MVGSENVLVWCSLHNLSVVPTKMLKKQIKEVTDKNSVLVWKDEYRTPLHSNLKAVHTAIIFSLIIFALGCIVPLLLFLFTDFKIIHSIYLTTASPALIILCYIAFAPVICPSSYPSPATEEWRSMHIRFPTEIL